MELTETQRERLFTKNIKYIYPFDTEEGPQIKKKRPIIYTIWKGKEWIYVGIAGFGEKKDPQPRLRQHWKGRRSGNQFCVYVHDKYIVPELDLKNYEFGKVDLDEKTRDYIRKYFHYCFAYFDVNDSRAEIQAIEEKLKVGDYSEDIKNEYDTPLLQRKERKNSKESKK